MLYKTFRILDSIYLWLLGIGVGCIVALGMFAAPIIFRASSFLPHISVEHSGVLMAQIFLKCNAFFNFLACVIIVYELVSLLRARFFTHSIQRYLWTILGGINVCLIALFTLYYTPSILDSHLQTNMTDFDTLHKQSEFVFKALFVGLSALMIWRGVLGNPSQKV